MKNWKELVKIAKISRCIVNYYASFLIDVSRLFLITLRGLNFLTEITTKRFKLVKQNLKRAQWRI